MKVKSLIILTLLFTPLTTVLAAEKIKVTNVWVSEGPPMAKSLAGYMVIHNMGDQAIMLRSITSENFERSEFHKTEIKDGMARMTLISHLVIKPHSKLSFEPGKFHLMLINPQKAFKAGDKIKMTLQFTNGEKLSFNASVKRMSHMENFSKDKMHDDTKMDDDMHENDMIEDREEMKRDHMPHSH